MITKQQALEFIYDLSQKTEVMLDVSCGEMQFEINKKQNILNELKEKYDV